MTTPLEMARQVLALVPSGMEASVLVSRDRSGLTRFANSFIHQNVAEEGTTLSMTLESHGRVTEATAKVAGPDAVGRFVADTVETVPVTPVSEDWPGFIAPTPLPDRPEMPVPSEPTPADRAGRVKAFIDAGPGLRAAGYCQTGVSEVVYANSRGQEVTGIRSAAILDGIHQTDESAGSGHAASRSIDDLDGAITGSIAADRARRGVGATDLAPGDYEVVLAPEAVATLTTFLVFYGFNSKAVVEGQSFVRLGEHQFDERFGLVDDALDPRSLGLAFDTEGTPKRRLVLVEDGVSKALALDRRQASKLGVESTGHAVPFFGGYAGAIPTSVFVTPGSDTVEDLISRIDRGLYVSTFNYVRILDPRTTVATGLTRNGTFLIEKGEITRGVSNLRFTQSLAGAVAPGRVIGVGNDARLADGEFGPGMVHAPSMHLAGWRFTGGAGG